MSVSPLSLNQKFKIESVNQVPVPKPEDVVKAQRPQANLAEVEDLKFEPVVSYELKPGMFAKTTQVDLDPLT